MCRKIFKNHTIEIKKKKFKKKKYIYIYIYIFRKLVWTKSIKDHITRVYIMDKLSIKRNY